MRYVKLHLDTPKSPNTTCQLNKYEIVSRIVLVSKLRTKNNYLRQLSKVPAP